MSDTHEGQENQIGAGQWPPPPSGPPAPHDATGQGSQSPPSGSGGYPGGWFGGGTVWTPPASPPQQRPPRRGRISVVVAALLLVVAAAAGVGIGHLAWSPGVSAAEQGSATAPNSSAGSGSGSSGSSGNGELPFGSGGTTSPYYGGLPTGSGTQPGGSSSGGSEGAGAPSDVAAIAAKVDPGLVDVNSTFSYQQAQGSGTGIVLTSTGEILTNNHVIDGATKISVTDVGNGKTYGASVIGYDSTHDIAVLQLQGASGLQTVRLGDSSKAATGESVVAIGNAGGTGGTPASAGGSITGLNQSITAGDELDGTSEQLSGLIEVNADIQPGDSGGTLVNSDGEVLGMDTAASDGFSFESTGSEGYAIPIDQALATASQIESGQGSSDVHVGPTALLGVLISPESDSGSVFGGGSGGSGTASMPGAAVSGVVSGGSAQKAGLVAGDVITSLDGQSIDSASALSKLLVSYHPGDTVQVGWTDASAQTHTATVDLGSGPPA